MFVKCPQGHKIAANVKLAGKQVKCPKCGYAVQIPKRKSQELDDERVRPRKPAARARKAKKKSSSGFSTRTILAIAGGAVAGLSVLGLLAWFVFGESVEEPPTIADNNVAQSEDRVPARSATTTPQPVTTKPKKPKAIELSSPAREPQELDLTKINLDKRLFGFKLPGTTWAAAYDEVTGRLAISNDEKGILVYDFDELLKGNPGPVAILPTDGLPTAICLKALPDRRVFVIAGQDEARLHLVDTDSLEPIGTIKLEGLKFVDFLAGSPNPDDPFVYYSSDRYQSVGASASEGVENETADRLGRVNLVTGKQDGQTRVKFADVAVSSDGERLYARPNSSANGVTGNWSELLNYNGDHNRSRIRNWSRSSTTSPACSLGEFVCINNSVFNQSMSIQMAKLDYAPGALFHHRPLLVGLSKSAIVFGSANDYRQLASIPLPGNWLRTDRRADPSDFRLRHDVSPSVRTRFLDIKADGTRELAIVTFGEHLVLAPLDKIKLPSEPSLFVRTSLPKKVTPGVQFQMKLKADTEATVFKYVPNTDWLQNEKQRLLGNRPPGESSPRPLQLRAGVTAEQSFIFLKDLKPLAGRKLPMNLRIGNEVMQVTKLDKGRLIVKRTNPVGHGFSERIAVIDKDGRNVTTPSTPAEPKGKRLILSAAIGNKQSIIFVNDLHPISGEKLPLDIQIGDETVTVVAVDDFKTALIVKRTEPASHSVTSDVFVLAAPASEPKAPPSLPTVNGHTLTWTPTTDQIGMHTIRIQSRSGDVIHDWFWDVSVERAEVELPFQVVGIEPELGTHRAVIWGQTVLPFHNTTPGSKPQANSYFIGIYHLDEKRLLQHVEVPKPIMAAALHETGVYAALIAFDTEPKADQQAENARQRASRQITPTRIVRFDAKTLDVVGEVVIPKHCNKLQVIAGKYLAAFERWRNEVYRFNISDLTPVEPPVSGYEYPIAGRLRDGWVWDGVVWDGQLKKPRLLLFPVHFERPPGAHSKPQMPANTGGTIHLRTQGPYVGTYCPQNQKLPGQIGLTEYPAGVSCTDGSVQVYSWANPSQPRVGSELKPTSVKLLDLKTVPGVRTRNTRQLQISGHVSEADGYVHVALLGKLYSVGLDRLVKREEAFRFVERQDRFVLEAGKSAKLNYSAPEATKYQLKFWYQRPIFSDEEPVFKEVSLNGKFELDLNDMERYANLAIQAVRFQSQDRTAKMRVDRVQEYLERITPAYRRLTGKKPRGVPLPIYVAVMAEHKDGQQFAGLAHSYLIEVPMKEVLKLANQR